MVIASQREVAAAVRSSIAAMVRDVIDHAALRLRGDPGQEVGAATACSGHRGLDPGPARLADPPADVVELADPVGVRVDREHAAVGDRAARPLDREVEAVRASR